MTPAHTPACYSQDVCAADTQYLTFCVHHPYPDLHFSPSLASALAPFAPPSICVISSFMLALRFWGLACLGWMHACAHAHVSRCGSLRTQVMHTATHAVSKCPDHHALESFRQATLRHTPLLRVVALACRVSESCRLACYSHEPESCLVLQLLMMATSGLCFPATCMCSASVSCTSCTAHRHRSRPIT